MLEICKPMSVALDKDRDYWDLAKSRLDAMHHVSIHLRGVVEFKRHSPCFQVQRFMNFYVLPTA
jgi:hypothetical protein